MGSNFSVGSMAALLFTSLLGLYANAIAADSPALPGIVIEVPTPPTPITEISA